MDAGPHVGPQERVVLLPATPAIPDPYPRAALVPGLDVVGARQLPRELRRRIMRGFPGRELSLDPGRSRFERMYANLLGAPANGLRIRLRRGAPPPQGSYRIILDARRRPRGFILELPPPHPAAQVTSVELESHLVAPANESARA